MTAIANGQPVTAPLPDMKVSVRQVFGFDSNMEVPAYSQTTEHVPDVDEDYLFNRETTLAILAGIVYGAMYALVVFVEPHQGEMTVRIPPERLNPQQ